MIVYNVTLAVDTEIWQEWLVWLKNEHIPAVMATGFFTEYKVLEVLADQNPETKSFAVQYLCESMSDFEVYEKKFAPALRKEVNQKYGNRCLSFRTLLRVV